MPLESERLLDVESLEVAHPSICPAKSQRQRETMIMSDVDSLNTEPFRRLAVNSPPSLAKTR
jgi:hypothetical protein